MQDIFSVTLNKEIFERVLNGKCSYIVVLNDKNRQKYRIGNQLTFICDDFTPIDATILNLLYFTNIKDLVDMLGKEKCGYTAKVSVDKIEDILYSNHKCEDIDKFGLVAIEVQKN